MKNTAVTSLVLGANMKTMIPLYMFPWIKTKQGFHIDASARVHSQTVHVIHHTPQRSATVHTAFTGHT